MKEHNNKDCTCKGRIDDVLAFFCEINYQFPLKVNSTILGKAP
jgi:hypothetical protein